MNCLTSGIIGLGMFGASFATMSVSKEQHDILNKTFTKEQQKIYEEIVKERRSHYFQGLVLGFLTAFFILRLTKTTNLFHRITFLFSIAFTVGVLYYFLMPKSNYMLNYLKTPVQTDAWLEIYKMMKQRYFLGLVISAVAAVPISFALCAL